MNYVAVQEFHNLSLVLAGVVYPSIPRMQSYIQLSILYNTSIIVLTFTTSSDDKNEDW